MTLALLAAIGMSCVFLRVLLEGGGAGAAFGAAVVAIAGAGGVLYYFGRM